MRRVHPESRLDDLPFYCIGFKSAGPEFTLRAHIWALLRFQTLYCMVSGMMNVQQRQQRMSMCVAFFSISSFSGLMLRGSSSWIRILYALLTRVWKTGRAKCTNAREQLEHVKLMSSHRGFPDYQETFSNRLTAEVRSIAASKSGRETFISSIGFHLHDLPEISTWYILGYLTFA